MLEYTGPPCHLPRSSRTGGAGDPLTVVAAEPSAVTDGDEGADRTSDGLAARASKSIVVNIMRLCLRNTPPYRDRNPIEFS
ncbi:hypothetical protein ACFL36_06280 [Thermodesulfobacteriota bacterium]